MPNPPSQNRPFSPISLTVIVGIIVFGSLAIELYFRWKDPPIQNHSLQTELSHARILFIAMEHYARDHNGAFPFQAKGFKPFQNANEAFRLLVPDYVPTKRVFYSKTSFWTPRPPDETVISGITPEAGENHFAYIPNLTKDSNPRFPLIASGFGKGTPGIYNAETQKQKGLKDGVVVLRADGSGKLKRLSKADFRVYDDDGNGGKFDIFKPSTGWLRPDQAPLNPEG